jgi:YD repeat-containing protein
VTSPNGYDAHGNLLQSTRTVNGVAETTTNVYDGYGRLTSTTDASTFASLIATMRYVNVSFVAFGYTISVRRRML